QPVLAHDILGLFVLPQQFIDQLRLNGHRSSHSPFPIGHLHSFIYTLETSRFSIRKLILAAGLSGSYGGLKVSASTHAGSLDTIHFLFDESAAFSAILKMFDHDPNAKLDERDFAQTSVWTLHAGCRTLRF
ncbi:MAG: hypothetical protein ACHQLQ_14110, partial [Candidatus Acidiferrales bacterium]